MNSFLYNFSLEKAQSMKVLAFIFCQSLADIKVSSPLLTVMKEAKPPDFKLPLVIYHDAGATHSDPREICLYFDQLQFLNTIVTAE